MDNLNAIEIRFDCTRVSERTVELKQFTMHVLHDDCVDSFSAGAGGKFEFHYENVMLFLIFLAEYLILSSTDNSDSLIEFFKKIEPVTKFFCRIGDNEITGLIFFSIYILSELILFPLGWRS